MTAGALDWLDPRVEQFVLSGDGEIIRDEVRRHWMASAFPAVRIGIGVLAFATAWLVGGLWLLLLVAVSFGLVSQALWRMITHYRVRFVVTDRRVFTVHGNVNQVRAGLPMTGISTVEVEQPWLGRVFGYGHLRLAAAAFDQGQTEVRWVPDPVARAASIRAAMADQLAGIS